LTATVVTRTHFCVIYTHVHCRPSFPSAFSGLALMKDQSLHRWWLRSETWSCSYDCKVQSIKYIYSYERFCVVALSTIKCFHLPSGRTRVPSVLRNPRSHSLTREPVKCSKRDGSDVLLA